MTFAVSASAPQALASDAAYQRAAYQRADRKPSWPQGGEKSRVCDQSVLKLLRQILRAGVMEDGQVRRPVTGTPQGGVISPLMCNVYLHRLDRAWDEHDGILVRYADDLVVMCFSRSQAERALARLVELLGELGLSPKASKTRIVHLATDGEGFDFLGFHHRQVRSRGLHGRRRVEFLARWPSNRAMQHARDRIREITARRRLPLHPEAIVEDLNLFLRGWMAYFRYGHSARRFSKIGRFARERVAHFVSRKHRRSRAFGWWVLTISSPNELGLVSQYGTVVALRAGKPWRERPNAAGERRR